MKLKQETLERKKLKEKLKKLTSSTYRRIYKLETENALLKELFEKYQKVIVTR